MKLNVGKWYKDPNRLGITTQTNQHICNIFLPNLLLVCEEYDTKNETIIVYDLLQLFDASYQLVDSVETRMYQHIQSHHIKQTSHTFGHTYLANDIESASEQLFNNINAK